LKKQKKAIALIWTHTILFFERRANAALFGTTFPRLRSVLPLFVFGAHPTSYYNKLLTNKELFVLNLLHGLPFYHRVLLPLVLKAIASYCILFQK